MEYDFETRMEVRDYECDIEGIVNNANYLHYLEHTRHLFLKSRNWTVWMKNEFNYYFISLLTSHH